MDRSIRTPEKGKKFGYVSTVSIGIGGMAALLAICVQVYLNPATRFQLWVLAAMLGLSLGSEVLYQVLKRRSGNR